MTIKKLIKDYGDIRISLNKLENDVTPWSDANADTRMSIKAKIYNLRANARDYKSKDDVSMARAKLIYEASFELEDELDGLGEIPDED